MNLRKRWEIFNSYIGWEDYLGGAIFQLGVLGLINEGEAPCNFSAQLAFKALEGNVEFRESTED